MRQAMKNQALTAIICLLLANCFADTGGSGTYSPSSSSSGSGGSETPVSDAFPPGAVSFFRKVACPTDWEFFPAAHGRAIIAASEGLPRGSLIGEPLAQGENREHEHAVSAMVDVPVTEIAGIEGGGNDGMTPAGMYAFSSVSSRTAADVPYTRLLTCKKREPPAPNALPLPEKLHTYFDLDTCPSGWKPAVATQGRLVVGLPPKAPADLPFGGKSMTSPELPTHLHSFESTFSTMSHGVALASGCCGKFGQNGMFTVAGETMPASVDMPMIALLHCEKE
jgi:hypothetical protein